MKRRLYFVLPDTKTAHLVEKGLLLAHVDSKHIHFMAKDESGFRDLPTASFTQRTDILPSMWHGLFFGGLTGTVAGCVVYFMPEVRSLLGMGSIMLLGIVGGVLGIWMAGMIGVSLPNSQLKRFEKTLQEGHVLLMVDVPKDRVGEISDLINKHNGDVETYGVEPAFPAFP